MLDGQWAMEKPLMLIVNQSSNDPERTNQNVQQLVCKWLMLHTNINNRTALKTSGVVVYINTAFVLLLQQSI